RLALHIGQHRRTVREIDFRPFLLPLHLAGLAIEGQQARRFRRLIALQDQRILVQHRTGTDGYVKLVRRDFLAPAHFALEIESGQHGGAEEDVDPFAVAGRRWHRVTAAQILSTRPGTVFDPRIPQLFAVAGTEANDVMFGERLLIDAGRPIAGGEEDATAADDRAGLILILLRLVALPRQERLPADVQPILATPLEGESLFLADALASRPTPCGPVCRMTGAHKQEQTEHS